MAASSRGAHGALSFAEQIAFFRRKLNLPTASWTQLFQEGHDHAFVVAGANRDALVADFRQAIDQAIADGTTLEAFRGDFDRIVAKHGWSYHGSRGWRSKVIYDTNLRTSYAAGRYAQLQAVKHQRPYWEFVHTPVAHPRETHVAWSGKVLHADDPWWGAHYPPDGWGCQCVVNALSDRDLARRGKSGPDTAPPIEYETRTIGQTGPAPRTVRVPKGVDPGFAYTPGATAWGRYQAEHALALGQTPAADWQHLTAGGWADYNRPQQIPRADAPALGQRLADPDRVAAELRKLAGASNGFFRPGGVPITVVPETLAAHVPADRSRYLPLLVDTLTDPYEVWARLERNGDYYELRVRALKLYRLPGRDRGMLLVADGSRGFMQSWTFLPVKQTNYLQRQRSGVLVYGK